MLIWIFRCVCRYLDLHVVDVFHKAKLSACSKWIHLQQ